MVAEHIPLVSVVIPVYNGERYLKDAVESVLGQTYGNIEIITVDDGSTDGSISILKSFSEKYGVVTLTHKNRRNLGVSRSRKLGVENAGGEYIAFLDADDVFLPDKIERQVSSIQSHPEVVLCHHDIEIISEANQDAIAGNRFSLAKKRYVYRLQQEPDFLLKNNISNSTVMVRTVYLRKMHFGFNQLFQFEDWLVWILLAEQGPFLFLPDRLTYYRYHSLSATAQVVRNPLVWQFSHLELLLSAISRLQSESNRKEVFRRIQSTIMNLFLEYTIGSDKSNEEVRSMASEFKEYLFETTSEGVDEATVTWNASNLAQHVRFNRLLLAIALKALSRFRPD